MKFLNGLSAAAAAISAALLSPSAASAQAMETVPARAPGEGEGPYPVLVIRGATMIQGNGSPPRGPVDIVVKGNLISRLHARIEYSRNKFLLIDQSTNGTFVTTREGEEAFVRRDSMQLKGEGLIGFGRVPEAGSNLTLKYVCEE